MKINLVINEIDLLFFERFSRYNKMIRVTAHCLNFMTNTKRNKLHQTSCLLTREIIKADIQLIKIVQINNFSNEIRILKSNRLTFSPTRIINF